MQEVRCIIFDEREVFSAVVEARRLRKVALPPGVVDSIALYEDAMVHVAFNIIDGHGRRIKLDIGEGELAAALVRYLISRNVPLAQKMKKMLIVTDNQLGLVLYDSSIPFRRGRAVDDLVAFAGNGYGPDEPGR